jgi:hypothetical protein
VAQDESWAGWLVVSKQWLSFGLWSVEHDADQGAFHLAATRMRKEAVRIRPCSSLHELAIAGDLHCVPNLKVHRVRRTWALLYVTTGPLWLRYAVTLCQNSVDDHAWAVTTASADCVRCLDSVQARTG